MIVLIPVILAAITGNMPSFECCWGLLAAVIWYRLVYYQNGKRNLIRGTVYAGIIISMLCVLGKACGNQIFQYRDQHEKEYLEIRNALIDGQYLDVGQKLAERSKEEGNFAQGGIRRGNLKNLDCQRSQGTEEMEITVGEPPTSRIYVKAFVGTTYTGEEWKELGRSKLLKLGSNRKRLEILNEPYERIKTGNNSLNRYTMKLRPLGASAKHGYMPYFAKLPENTSVNLDAVPKGSRKDEIKYQYYNRVDAEQLSSENELGDSSDNWKKYQEFVKENYMKYPEELTELTKYCDELKAGSVESVSRNIDRMFSETLDYRRIPGKKPADQDFVEYFLFENHKGFCVHFASAATLIYRKCGYPARYVSGYAVDPSAFTDQPDRTYKAMITDEMAHAWCEVFDPEKGWIVQEHTLSYMGDDELESQSTGSTVHEESPNDIVKKNEDNNTEETESEKRNESEEKVSNTGGVDNDKVNVKIKIKIDQKAVFKLFLNIIMCLLAGVLVFLLQKKIRYEKKMYRFRKRKNNQGILSIYNEICELCSYQGMEMKNLSERQILDKMKNEFQQISPEEWNWMYDCAERSAFAGKETEKEEYKKMYRLYKQFRKQTLSQMSGWRKFWLIYVKGV